jgi:hypothetical protein
MLLSDIHVFVEHVLVVPVKNRINGVLETIQQKVVSYEAYQTLKNEVKDAKDSIEMLKQKASEILNEKTGQGLKNR